MADNKDTDNVVGRLSKDFEESNPPPGVPAATGQFASSAVVEGEENAVVNSTSHSSSNESPRDSTRTTKGVAGPVYENGYHFPPSYKKGEVTKYGAKSFLRYTFTPLGFFVVLYGLNVVAWGGMLFLLLCNASPAMCYPSCNNIDSPRRKWIEYTSQILTVLFCLPAFGLAPWRFRDLYYNLKFRLKKDQSGLRRLGGIHRDWFRMPGSAELPVDIGPENVETRLADAPATSIPIPMTKIPTAPLTGVRAPATPVWKMDLMIWLMVWNTLFQCVLCGFMWGMNRYDRPSWSTGLFVCLGCLAAIWSGLLMFFEGKKVKAIEGVPLTDRDRERLARDEELGVQHYNNIKDKVPETKEEKKARKARAKADK